MKFKKIIYVMLLSVVSLSVVGMDKKRPLETMDDGQKVQRVEKALTNEQKEDIKNLLRCCYLKEEDRDSFCEEFRSLLTDNDFSFFVTELRLIPMYHDYPYLAEYHRIIKQLLMEIINGDMSLKTWFAVNEKTVNVVHLHMAFHVKDIENFKQIAALLQSSLCLYGAHKHETNLCGFASQLKDLMYLQILLDHGFWFNKKLNTLSERFFCQDGDKIFHMVLAAMPQSMINEPLGADDFRTMLHYALQTGKQEHIEAVLKKGAVVAYEDIAAAKVQTFIEGADEKTDQESQALLGTTYPLLKGALQEHDQTKEDGIVAGYTNLVNLLIDEPKKINKLIRLLRQNRLNLDFEWIDFSPDFSPCSCTLTTLVGRRHDSADALTLLLGYGASFEYQALQDEIDDNFQESPEKEAFQRKLREFKFLEECNTKEMKDIDDEFFLAMMRSVWYGGLCKKSLTARQQSKAMMWFTLRYPYVARHIFLYAPYPWLDPKAENKKDIVWLTNEVKKYDRQTYALWMLGANALNTHKYSDIKINCHQ